MRSWASQRDFGTYRILTPKITTKNNLWQLFSHIFVLSVFVVILWIQIIKQNIYNNTEINVTRQ